MLNLNEIAARIKQPASCTVHDIDSLRTLCDTYPYSQIFPLLYLKTLAQTNDVRLDGELQRFAYKIADRVVLFELLNSKKTGIGSEKDVFLTESTSDLISEEQKSSDLPDQTEKTESDTVTTHPVLASEQKKEVSSSEEEKTENNALPPAPISQQAETQMHSAEKQEKEELPSLPDDLLNAIGIGTESYSLEAEEAKISQQKEAERQEQIEREVLEQEKQRLIEALAQKKPVVKSEEVPVHERSFTSWLKHNSAYTEPVEKKPDPGILIEHFIQSEPKISTPKEKLFEDRSDKKEMFSPTKKAKESLDEKQLPVSETLAKIFAAQGNYPKAIFAYQQLMLIFPEKKVFFASQIEELNKKINL